MAYLLIILMEIEHHNHHRITLEIRIHNNDPMPCPKLKNHPGLLRLLEPKSKSQPEKRYMFLDINKVC